MRKIKVSHILVRQKYEAEDLQKKLAEGSPFEELARRSSTCPSAENGGSLGEIDPRRLDDDFREALELLKAGELSGIIRTRFGYHLIRRDS